MALDVVFLMLYFLRKIDLIRVCRDNGKYGEYFGIEWISLEAKASDC